MPTPHHHDPAESACLHCKQPIPATRGQQALYCSPPCRQAAAHARRIGQAPRLTPPERCARCDGPMPLGIRAVALYCSKRCREATTYARKRQRQGHTAPEHCAHCHGPMPKKIRNTARHCSKRCKDAAHRARMRARPNQPSPLPAEHLAQLTAQLTHTRRRRGGLPQHLLAARLHVVTTSLADWEAGRDHPTTLHLISWSRTLGLHLAITDPDGNETPTPPDHDTAPDEPEAHRELRRLTTTLRTARIHRRLSQSTLAARLGTTQRTITRWENARGHAKPTTLILWAHALHYTIRLLPS